MMELFTIAIEYKKETLHFDVADYMHHTETHCKFEVFADGKFAASFEPDNQKQLHICKNIGTIEEGILNLIADKLESLPHHGV